MLKGKKTIQHTQPPTRETRRGEKKSKIVSNITPRLTQ